ncbi:fungal-specific transcription factor domain-containing protein [Lasiosphaeria miniovina]|uniref:Fungal-specific transcription factor domain-containing protein n=1 Tax=Lasiosphaeria miniovina TaxID=1954250 RepID=A0AA40B553_9PEZI|nr:fungal-specific transcription factor domain-containing protein [Lasiosphaeria miniovina]KAK0727861.1 fungal-specific transcription factor domain-containing protein [Lasiosphaeria miniovina]
MMDTSSTSPGGPASPTSPAPSSAASQLPQPPTTSTNTNTSHSNTSHKPIRILACVLCQHRKIKCDRTFPCSNCTKAGVKCTPSTPAPARKRRRPNQDLQERLARCEELLKEYASEKPESPEPAVSRPPSQAPSFYEETQPKWQPPGKLVKEDGGGVRFMDNFLLGTVYDELRAMRQIVDADDHDEINSDTMTPDDNSDLLLGGESPQQNVENLWPEPTHVFSLWQIYLDRVNPLTKIIHVPTLQPFLANTTSGSHSIPRNTETLFFSIFLMACVSLTPDECQHLVGYSREEALQRFSSAVRQNLSRMGFLKSHDFTTLQALVIYMIALQGRYNRHAAWIMNGVVIRIAQKMGLHRDGEALGLGPFDTEMRRRVWWQIIMVDSKYALFSGLSHSLLPRDFDTKSPKNLNDADIHPSATEPFPDRDGPTEMIFCLLTCRFGRFLIDNPGLETIVMAPDSGAIGGISDEQVTEYRRIVENLAKELLDMLDRYSDAKAGPVHEMAVEMRMHIINKVMELVKPLKPLAGWGSEPLPSAQDGAFKIAVRTLEHNAHNYMSMKDRGFIWFSLLLFQLDVFMYMAGQLCHRTEGEIVDRAWEMAEVVYSFHPELFDTSNKVYLIIAQYILKAWRKREEILLCRTGEIPDTPFYVDKLQASLPIDDLKTEPTPPGPFTPASLGLGPPIGGPDLDQLFGGYLDTTALDWDMFGTSNASGDQSMASAFAGFGMGPSSQW